MTAYGYTLMCEEHGPKSLLRNAAGAEAAGFDFAVISDHFNPWLEAQGNSPFAWSMLGAIAERTEHLALMTMVTCPFIRYHPAIVAQAAATVAILSDGRFLLGLGAGENLNEHVVGRGWPPPDVRHEMLEESIEIIQRLFSGGEHNFHGRHLALERARLYSLPAEPPGLGVAAGAPAAARLAAEKGAALIATEPNPKLVKAYRKAGGTGPTYGQVGVCWAPSEAEAVATAVEHQRFAVPGWVAMAELPTPASFEAATRTVDEDDIVELVACGPDPRRHAEAIGAFVDAGFDHVAVLQVGPEQEGYLRFFTEELRPLLP
jgi:G6PDH family F420-dependent oxidoreductase